MKKIAIIGAGQAGLQLGFGLLAKGYQVQIYTDKTADEVFRSWPPPVPVQFYPSIGLEKELGLNFWENEQPCKVEGVRFDLYDPVGNYAFTIKAPLQHKAQTVDLRLKYSVWMREFEKRGGNISIAQVSIALLEQLTQEYDLVLVSTGRSDTTQLFEKDTTRSVFESPQRKLALFYVRNCRLNYSDASDCGGASYNILQGVGELLMSPFLSKDQERVFYILVEAIPGGPLDIFDKNAPATQQLEAAKHFFKEKYPPLYKMIERAELVNEGEWVCGAITPVVKKVVGYLPSGRYVMGLGDVVILNDPLMAQGLNGASKMADFVCKAIVANNGKLDDKWMKATFDAYWETAQYSAILTNTMLGVPAPHQIEILMAASQNPLVAQDLVNGIGNAHVLFPWFGDAEEARKYLSLQN